MGVLKTKLVQVAIPSIILQLLVPIGLVSSAVLYHLGRH
jgi:hypothetical protein